MPIAAENVGYKAVHRDHNLRPSQDLLIALKTNPGLFSASVLKPDEFDIVWFDLAIDAEVVRKLKPH